jgi:peptidoglycan hydrolase CwlO-like protein
MTSPTGMPRRVTRLENDVHSIYEMVGDIQSIQRDHGHKLDRLTGRVDRIEAKVDHLETRFDHLETRFDALSSTVDGHTATLDHHTAVLADHTVKLDTILELLRAQRAG